MIQLLVASIMVALTVLLHLAGLSALLEIMRRRPQSPRAPGRLFRQGGAILAACFGLFALHTIEIWGYAVLYVFLHALGTFEEALYFSTVTYTSLGYGDVTLPKTWRILGGIEAANGLILLGWSTAFFVSIVEQIRRIEAQADGEEDRPARRGGERYSDDD